MTIIVELKNYSNPQNEEILYGWQELWVTMTIIVISLYNFDFGIIWLKVTRFVTDNSCHTQNE